MRRVRKALRADIWDIVYSEMSCGRSHEDTAEYASGRIVAYIQNNYRRRKRGSK